MTQALWDQLGITGWQALALAIDATVLFWLFTLVMAHLGQQMRARVTVTTFAIMTVVGSIIARAMLGPNPTMASGILVLAVLFAWEGLFRLVGARLPQHLIPVRQARLVVRDGVIDHEALRTTHLRYGDLMVRLRRAGATQLAGLAYVILERDGSLSIVRVGQPLDPEFLKDVAGLETQPGH